MKTCSECGEQRRLEEFHRHRGRSDGRQRVCKDCKSAYNANYYRANASRHASMREAHRRRLRARVLALLREHKDKPCADCGRTLPAEAMDLDHVRGWKRGGAGWIRQQGLPAARTELAKCEVVCVNCHRARTTNRRRRNELLAQQGWWVPSESNRQPFG